MSDFATLEIVKELLDDWSEEATRLAARAYRGDESEINGAEATRLRECVAELGAVFPDAKLWHAEGVVPAAPDDLEPFVRQLVEKWREGGDAAACMREICEALEPGVPNNDGGA